MPPLSSVEAGREARAHRHRHIRKAGVPQEANGRQRPSAEQEQRIDRMQKQGRFGYNGPGLGGYGLLKELENGKIPRKPPAGREYYHPEQYWRRLVDMIGFPNADDGKVRMEVIEIPRNRSISKEFAVYPPEFLTKAFHGRRTYLEK